MSVSYGGDKITFDDGSSLSTGYTHFRNRVINGDMRIDQRNAGAAQTWNNSNGYSLDRFFVYNSGGGGVFTTQRIADGPTGTAFANSMRVTITTADSSFGSGDVYFVQHKIEGFNVADLEWGTANAKTVTVSFWVKSSVTGSFPFTMIDAAGGSNYRSYGVLYTINAANTWEYKTITVPGETAGAAWGKSNDVGMHLSWGLGAGTNYVVSPNVWTTSKEAYKVSGDTNLISTLNATWQLTGVQLEVGSYATTFERRPFGTELQLCQRYYEHSYDGATNSGTLGMIVTTVPTVSNAYIPVQFKVTKRGLPTMQSYDTSNNVGKITTPAGSNQSPFAFERIGYSSAQLTTNSVNIGAIWFGWSANSEL